MILLVNKLNEGKSLIASLIAILFARVKFAFWFSPPYIPLHPYHDPTSIDCSTALLPYFYGFTPPLAIHPLYFPSTSSTSRITAIDAGDVERSFIAGVLYETATLSGFWRFPWISGVRSLRNLNSWLLPVFIRISNSRFNSSKLSLK